MSVRAADTFMRSLDLPEIYRVGGSVRDQVLGRKPKDADYVVRGASVDRIRRAILSAGAKPSALKLRDGCVIGQRANKRGLGLIEIALPRTEISTGPGRHDFEIVVDPTLSLKDDAIRRDFTINALYMDIRSNEIIDPLDEGLNAIKLGFITTTHENSFRDDPLRILRALRFVSTLGFELSAASWQEMIQHASSVTGLTQRGVSGTALEELNKLLMGNRPGFALRNARDVKVLEYFLPELKPLINYDQKSAYHDLTADEHVFTAIDVAAKLDAPLRVRLALLFHDSGKPATAWTGEDGRTHYYAPSLERWKTLGRTDDPPVSHEIMGAELARVALMRLNAPKRLRDDVVTLITHHMVPVWGKVRPAKVRKWRTQMGDALLADLFKHRLCDVMAKQAINYDALVALEKLEKIRHDAEAAGVPSKATDLKVDGRDMMELGLEGPEIGRVLKQLLHEVVSQPDRNQREWLLERAKKIK